MFFKRIFLGVLLLASNFLVGQHTIGKLTIDGLKKTKKKVITKILQTKVNAPLDTATLNKDILFLNRLPAVQFAKYTVAKADANYHVTFTIKENSTVLPELSIWTTTNQEFAYKIGLYDYNFLGNNMTLGGFYQKNIFDSYGINFSAPQLFSKKMGLSLNHQNWKSKEPLYFNDNTANYLYNNISFEALLLYQLNTNHSLNGGFNVFSEKYRYISGFQSATVPQQLNLDKLLFKLVYTFDALAYFYQYVSGFKSQLFAQYVVTENNFQNDFIIAWNDFFYFKRVGAKGNWANRLRLGLASNDNTPFAPFALDNNVNLRGVGILVDRGTGSFVLNTEYRHTIYDKKWLAIQTNIFADLGSWRTPGGMLNDFVDSDNIRLFSGVGLRFISKKIYNATFRVDYGFKIYGSTNNNKGGLVFGLGQYF